MGFILQKNKKAGGRMSRKFLRTGWTKKIRLGKGNKKKQKWRKARGRHNKIRESIRGKPRRVEIGFRTSMEKRFKIEGKVPVFIRNLRDMERTAKGNLLIIGKMGKKKRRIIEEMVKEKGALILNKNELK